MDRTRITQVGLISSVASGVLVSTFALLLVGSFWTNTADASYLVCFVLAPTFLVMMSSIHAHSSPESRFWSQLGVSLTIMYATLITITYYTQLTVVRVNSLGLTPQILEALTYTPGSFIFSLNMLGYGFMCLAVLITHPVFAGKGLGTWLRRLFILNGVFFLPTWAFPALSLGSPQPEVDFGVWALILWCILFIPLTGLVAVWFWQMLGQRCRPISRKS